ncbi:MAG: MIP/aquaporin family protein [Thermoanaerobaculia bacterium]
MQRYLTELIGTFFLVLTIGLTTVQGTAMAPLAIGSVLMVMVYMGGHISGGHYNPAVTFGAWLAGKAEARDLAPYWLAQLLGGFLAALTARGLANGTFAPAPGAEVGVWGTFWAEILFTFALVLVVLTTAASPATEGNSYFGLAIGFTVMVGAWAVGPISGAAFNPAVAVGPTTLHAAAGEGGWGWLWIYLVAPLAGGAGAAWVFRFQESAKAG